jgi:hypothetical protein
MLDFMFIENLGYVLSELPVLFLMIWFAVKIVQWRRARENRPQFSEDDRRVLFRQSPYAPDKWQFYPRFTLAVFAVMISGFLQVTILSAFGAAIITAMFVLTSAAVVRGVLLE